LAAWADSPKPFMDSLSHCYSIEPLSAELGIWHGKVDNHNLPWLRWWDSNGGLLLTGEERAKAEKQRADAEKYHADIEQERTDAEKQRADLLTAKLKEMGIAVRNQIQN
jgi:hypothetical protein